MLTKLTIRNFKRLSKVELDLEQTVVFVGPNNSGKTTTLQALALWDAGLKAWISKRSDSNPTQRSGVTLNRKDLISIPIPNANLLWKDLHVRRSVQRKTENILIEILAEGVTNGIPWACGLEFDYANTESFYCRLLRKDPAGSTRYDFPRPELVRNIRIAFLPAMSGLASVEPRHERGRLNVLIGEGQTAQVLRNLCFIVMESFPEAWIRLKGNIKELFGVELLDPEYLPDRGEIVMAYRERAVELDLSCAGRGLQQTLLLLSYMHANPNTILMLDEPDAHLEVLRQRQIYNLLQATGKELGCQILAASHSEVILNEAIGKDSVVAFVGNPHRVEKSAQVLKALQDYGFQSYLDAENKGWILFLEGSTDLAILLAWAEKLDHPAKTALQNPFVHYVGNNIPNPAREFYHALREAKPDLRGFALFDKIERPLKDECGLLERMWSRREIENFLCTEKVLMAWARGDTPEAQDLFAEPEGEQRMEVMRACIQELEQATQVFGKPSVWSHEIKATDDFLIPLFRRFADKMHAPALAKTHFHQLVRFQDAADIPAEVIQILDEIAAVAATATPAVG